MKTVFTGGAVVVDAHTELPSGHVVVERDRIVDVGTGPAPDEVRADADHIVDTTGTAVIPGFVNAHCHLFQSMLRGLSTNRCLEDWLAHDIWPYTRHLDAPDLHLAATAGLIDNLRSGVTTVLENQYVHHSRENTDQVAQAFADIGIRGLIARGAVDIDRTGGAHSARLETPREYLDNTAAFAQRWHGAAGGRIRCEAAIQTTWLASGELCSEISDFIKGHDIGLHAHCAETRASVQSTIDWHGVGEVDFFGEHGLLGPTTQLVHCVWLTPEEQRSIAVSGTVVVTCPVSNAYLASGPAPVSEMRARGIPVAVGCDGPGSNNGQNMFEAIKWSILSDRIRTLDPEPMTEVDALDMVWADGARAVGLSGSIGAVAPGHLADLVVVDIDSPAYAGSPTIRRGLVFGGSPADIVAVWVGGTQVVTAGEILTADRVEVSRSLRTRRIQILQNERAAV